MHERGARPINLPKPERPSVGDPETTELSTLITQAITIRGAQKADLVPHWLAVDVMRIIDPNRHGPDLVRRAAIVLLRDSATQTMRAYRPPSDALKLIEEEEAAYVRRVAAEDVAEAQARHIPSTCALCGKKHAEGQASLILQYSPPLRVCTTCTTTLIVNELYRRQATDASVRAAKALEAACLRDARRPRGKR
jgi:hypothetical protein